MNLKRKMEFPKKEQIDILKVKGTINEIKEVLWPIKTNFKCYRTVFNDMEELSKYIKYKWSHCSAKSPSLLQSLSHGKDY